eukprot:GHVS01074969.1.p1 GENE.GHVS01074969.1~~GHVS01074969.1.p1  ORF type:complete len:464 (-),score=61.93 GHVS01074969.1:662-2053(-)
MTPANMMAAVFVDRLVGNCIWSPPVCRSLHFLRTFATFRHNICSDDWIVFPGKERKARPKQTFKQTNTTDATATWSASCNFCVGNEHLLPDALQIYYRHDNSATSRIRPLKEERKETPDGVEEHEKPTFSWLAHDDVSSSKVSSSSPPDVSNSCLYMRVIPNRYPVVSTSRCIIDPSIYPFCVEDAITDCSQLADCLNATRRKTGGLQTCLPAVGFHEVVIDHRQHSVPLSDLDAVYWQMLFTAFRDRSKAIAEAAPLIQTVLCFKNEGTLGGASMHHPHSQLVGLPVVPQSQIKYHEIAREYFTSSGNCLFCDYIQQELTTTSRQRIVEETYDYLCVVPYAAHIPYHMSVFPKRHRHQFMDEHDEGLNGLGIILAKVFAKLNKLYKNPDFNLVLKNTHLHRGKFILYRPDLYYHWHVEIFPRLDSWPVAGFEFCTGIMCNSHFPEEDAEALRSGVLMTTNIW